MITATFASASDPSSLKIFLPLNNGTWGKYSPFSSTVSGTSIPFVIPKL